MDDQELERYLGSFALTSPRPLDAAPRRPARWLWAAAAAVVATALVAWQAFHRTASAPPPAVTVAATRPALAAAWRQDPAALDALLVRQAASVLPDPQVPGGTLRRLATEPWP
jgi:hypothetical protein